MMRADFKNNNQTNKQKKTIIYNQTELYTTPCFTAEV